MKATAKSSACVIQFRTSVGLHSTARVKVWKSPPPAKRSKSFNGCQKQMEEDKHTYPLTHRSDSSFHKLGQAAEWH